MPLLENMRLGPSPSDAEVNVEKIKVFPESSFFKKHASSLPTPAEIRAINEKFWRGGRPPPVKIPSLGLLVKYGNHVTTIEAETQIMIQEKFQNQVPVPEVFGWAKDGGDTFIYMSLIEGVELQLIWNDMNENEKLAVYHELAGMVKALRTLKQDRNDQFIGSYGKKPLRDYLLRPYSKLCRPFQGSDSLKEFQNICQMEINLEISIVFGHDELFPPNILLSRGPRPKVMAILDWEQAGWYPAYWESCKMWWIRLPTELASDALQEEWRTKFMPMCFDPVDGETCYHHWIYLALSIM